MPKIFSDADREIHKIILFDKGMELIAERGLKEVSVSELADLINVSKGYFYTLFESKEQYFLNSLIWRMEQNLNRLETAKKRGAAEGELYQLFQTLLFQTQRSYQQLAILDSIKYINEKVTPAQWERFREKAESHFMTILKIFSKQPSIQAAQVLHNLICSLCLALSFYPYQLSLFPEAAAEAVKVQSDALVAYIQALP